MWKTPELASSRKAFTERYPVTGKNLQDEVKWPNLPVALPDVLSCDVSHVYMRSQPFDLQGNCTDIITPRNYQQQQSETSHLFCQTGFLDDAWWHRSYWIYGEECGEGWGNYADPRKTSPCGRIMVVDDERAYAFRSDPLGNMLHPRTTYQLYAADKAPTLPIPAQDAKQGRRTGGRRGAAADPNSLGRHRVHWRVDSLPLLVNTMPALTWTCGKQGQHAHTSVGMAPQD